MREFSAFSKDVYGVVSHSSKKNTERTTQYMSFMVESEFRFKFFDFEWAFTSLFASFGFSTATLPKGLVRCPDVRLSIEKRSMTCFSFQILELRMNRWLSSNPISKYTTR